MIWARTVSSFFVPGLGHAMAGRWIRAMVWAVVGLASVFALTMTIWAIYGSLVVRVACCADVFFSTRRLPAARAIAALIATSLAGAVGLCVYLFGISAFRFPSSSMIPTLRIGDHVYVDRLNLRGLHRGDVIVFHMPCNPAREYGKRIVALGGDTVEIRCDIVYVNGKAAKQELVAREARYQDFDEMAHEPYDKPASHYRETLDGRSHDVFFSPDRPDRETDPDAHPKDYPLQRRAPSCADNRELGVPNTKQPTVDVVHTKDTTNACELQDHIVVPPGSLFVMGDSRDNSNDSRFWGVVPESFVIGRVIGIWSPIGRTGDVE